MIQRSGGARSGMGSEYPRLIQVSGRMRDNQSATDGTISTAIFFDVLFSDVARWDQPPFAVADRGTKDPLRLKDNLSVMSQRAMAKIAKSFFGGIQPLMNRLVVLNPSTETTHRGLRVKDGVRHSPSCSVVS